MLDSSYDKQLKYASGALGLVGLKSLKYFYGGKNYEYKMKNYTFALRESSFKCTVFRAHKPTISAYVFLRYTTCTHISHISVSVLVCAVFTQPLLLLATFTFYSAVQFELEPTGF